METITPAAGDSASRPAESGSPGGCPPPRAAPTSTRPAPGTSVSSTGKSAQIRTSVGWASGRKLTAIGAAVGASSYKTIGLWELARGNGSRKAERRIGRDTAFA